MEGKFSFRETSLPLISTALNATEILIFCTCTQFRESVVVKLDLHARSVQESTMKQSERPEEDLVFFSYDNQAAATENGEVILKVIVRPSCFESLISYDPRSNTAVCIRQFGHAR